MHTSFYVKQLFTKIYWTNSIKITNNNLGMVDASNGDQIGEIHWRPECIFQEPYKPNNGHGCLVVNRDIKIPPQVVSEIWQNAAIRCCVDGGSNRWLHFLKNHNKEYKLKMPDLITGDFDSISLEAREYFSKKGIRMMHTPDQNHTDFSKAVDIVKPMVKEKQLKDIIVFHDTSGRIDQIMSTINTLFTRHDNLCNIYLLSGNSLTWLLKPGKHSILIPEQLVKEKRWCALIPIGHEATDVTTNGLKWNLTHGCLSFGGMVSSSNTYASSLVEVETNSALIWSMGVFSFQDD